MVTETRLSRAGQTQRSRLLAHPLLTGLHVITTKSMPNALTSPSPTSGVPTVSNQAHLRIEEIAIAKLRRDYAMIVRGMFVLSIIPAMAFVSSVMHKLGNEPDFKIELFYTWSVWVPLILTHLRCWHCAA